MASVHDVPGDQSRLARVLTTDFCPWANRFVYWLKEPIGWFALATAGSCLVGLYANPMGWTIAGALSAIIAVGMLWPLVAVWSVSIHARPEVREIHEGSACEMILSVRNRLPLPVWGLAVDHFLVREAESDLPTVALSHVPPISTADFWISMHPELRGHYPQQSPQITCSFPFGIWTARRTLRSYDSLTVWPRVYPIQGVCPLRGLKASEFGDGQRGGQSGDFVGVRGFRRGDSPRNIHWAHSARTDSLIVTERGGPQSPALNIIVDPTLAGGFSPSDLSLRVRVAASIVINLHASSIPMRVLIGTHSVRHGVGPRGRRQLLDAFAAIPIEGSDVRFEGAKDAGVPRIEIVGSRERGDHKVLVRVVESNVVSRAHRETQLIEIDGFREIGPQLSELWQELERVTIAA